jgi:hypothetical protein
MNTYTPQEIQEILTKHQLWREGKEGGERASLAGADLAEADLEGANLTNVSLLLADLEGADLTDANLMDADLMDADLTDADLTRANFTRADLTDAILTGVRLCRAFGNMREIKSLQLETYQITYTAQVLQIGCKQYPIADWWEFTDEQISKMDGQKALDWWRKWKDHIRATIELSPATPTGKKKS